MPAHKYFLGRQMKFWFRKHDKECIPSRYEFKLFRKGYGILTCVLGYLELRIY